jgi:AcrR family transcriptional regulator
VKEKIGRTERGALSRERVLTAIAVADAGGVPAVTIRSLADKLGVKRMSVYNYVANKDELLDAIVDLVFGEIELPHPAATGKSRCGGGPPRRGLSKPLLPGEGTLLCVDHLAARSL